MAADQLNLSLSPPYSKDPATLTRIVTRQALVFATLTMQYRGEDEAFASIDRSLTELKASIDELRGNPAHQGVIEQFDQIVRKVDSRKVERAKLRVELQQVQAVLQKTAQAIAGPDDRSASEPEEDISSAQNVPDLNGLLAAF